MGARGHQLIGVLCIALSVGLSLMSEHTYYHGLVIFRIFRIIRGAGASDPPGAQVARPAPDDPRWQPSTPLDDRTG